MTDRGPSAAAGWGCGNVGNPGPDRGTAESAGKDCPHFHGPNQKRNYLLKSPAGLLRNGKRRTGTGRRQRRVWEAWSIQAPNPKPERSANKDCPPLSMLAAPPRIQRRPFTNKPPTSGSVGRMWSIRAPNAKPRNGANKDCPQAFHALRAAANEKRANDPKRQKSGTMSGFIIGSGRIGPGAAPERQNRHEPSTTRSRRNSTRISTTARYSCLVGQNVFLANGIVTCSSLASAFVQFPCQVPRTVESVTSEATRNFLPKPFRLLSHRVVFCSR